VRIQIARRARKRPKPSHYWSARVTRESHALSLDANVFRFSNPRRIAASLKRSAESSRQRKGTPFQSAMSMLNFYVNRAGRSLPPKRKIILERAKTELQKAFDRE
jgi:uncharacterized protein DUF3175